ncbi:MAG: hypothetical protein LBC83_02320 [Oscillospiraceae bacterium]|jgi:hypothetical protein|nr:hypothetical protein [Oscillospiraceae bacterium]
MQAQNTKIASLPRAASPEMAGVSAARVARLLEDAVKEGLELHSIMVLRRGVVAFEHFRAP